MLKLLSESWRGDILLSEGVQILAPPVKILHRLSAGCSASQKVLFGDVICTAFQLQPSQFFVRPWCPGSPSYSIFTDDGGHFASNLYRAKVV
jgi:hypothetical protein